MMRTEGLHNFQVPTIVSCPLSHRIDIWSRIKSNMAHKWLFSCVEPCCIEMELDVRRVSSPWILSCTCFSRSPEMRAFTGLLLFYPFGEVFSNRNFCQSNAQTCRILDFTLSIDETFKKLEMKPPPSTSTSSYTPWEWTLQNHGSTTERFSSRCMYITSMGTPPVGSYSLS
jgi:hypothetical protein